MRSEPEQMRPIPFPNPRRGELPLQCLRTIWQLHRSLSFRLLLRYLKRFEGFFIDQQ